jgi:hypothetical protein
MWLYNGAEFHEDMIGTNAGFIYLITNLDTGRMYVGKKNFTKAKTFQRNKRKKRTRVASDWVTYTGSNDELNEDIQNGARIKKEIIHLCPTKGWMSYLETKEIFDREALLSPKFYNGWVSCKIRRNHLKGEKWW